MKNPEYFMDGSYFPPFSVIGAIGPVARYGLTAFFPTISAEMHWSRSEIGLAQSISLWAYAVFSIPAGWMVDRLGGRKTLFIGGILCLGGWLALATVHSLWQLYLYYGIFMAMVVSVTHVVVLQATSRKWFIRQAGLAGGIIGSAFALGNAVFTPILTSTTSVFGWREVAVGCAFAFSIPIMLLAYLVVRDTPESVGLRPLGHILVPGGIEQKSDCGGQSTLRCPQDPQFWLLFIAYSFSGMVINGLLAHMVVWVSDFGTTAALAGLFVTMYNAPSIISRVAGGWLGDRLGKTRVLIFGATLAAAIMLIAWRWARGVDQLFILVPVMGLGINLATGLYAPHLGDLFGRRNVGSLFAILTAGWGLIGGLGPILWGLIYDNTHSYNIALFISILCYAVAALSLFLARNLRIKNAIPGIA